MRMNNEVSAVLCFVHSVCYCLYPLFVRYDSAALVFAAFRMLLLVKIKCFIVLEDAVRDIRDVPLSWPVIFFLFQ